MNKEKLEGLENLQSRTELWKAELINDKSSRQHTIEFDSEKIRSLQKDRVLNEKTIDLIDAELIYTDSELKRLSEEIKSLTK